MASISLSLAVTSACVTNQGGSAPAWTPASLFASGEDGIWIDPSDLSTLYQDGGGFTNVTSSSQTVRLATNKLAATPITKLVTVQDDVTFASDTGFWTKDSGVAITGGQAEFTSVADNAGLRRTTGITSGTPYVVTFTVVSRSGGAFRPYLGGTYGTERNTPGTYSEVVVAGATNTIWGIVGASGPTSGVIDDVSFIELDGFTATAGTPTYTESAGVHAINFASDLMKSGTTVDLSGASAVTVLAALRQRTFGTSPQVVYSHNAAFNASGVELYLNNGTPSGSVGAGYGVTSNYLAANSGGASSERAVVVVATFDPSGADADAKLALRIDGADVNETQPASAGTVSTSAFTDSFEHIGGRVGGALPLLNDDIIELIVIDRALTAGEISSAETYLLNKSGLSPGFNLAPVSFSDTGAVIDAGGYYQTSPFASLDVTTEATVFDVVVTNSYYGSYPSLTEIGVYVDGVYNQSINPASTGETSHTIFLSSGSKLVSFVNGPQSNPSGTLTGTFLKSVAANSAMTQSVSSPSNRLLIYGDSIAVGQAASPVQEKAWAMQVRAAAYGGAIDSVALEGWGSRSLHQDCNTAELRAAFVSKVAAYSPSIIWLAIGTNDYGLNKWAAADFGTAYAALLDDLNTELPSATIYCQTPIVRTTETANGSGSTLGDYRTQIATAVSTRTSFATLVDGTAFMTTAGLADGVHPTTAGHDLYAAAVISALGIV